MPANTFAALAERFEKAVRGHENAIVGGSAMAVIFDESQERIRARAALLAYGAGVERECEKFAKANADYEDAKAGESQRDLDAAEYARDEAALHFQHWWESFKATRPTEARDG